MNTECTTPMMFTFMRHLLSLYFGPICSLVFNTISVCISSHLTNSIARVCFVFIDAHRVQAPVSRKSQEPGFRSRKAGRQTSISLFWKADLLTCFWCGKNQEDCEVWWLRTSALRRYKGNCDTRNRPEKFRDFWKQAQGPVSRKYRNSSFVFRVR